jgi:tripartite-type tricarboxylate transporter receptor subunit TctC
MNKYLRAGAGLFFALAACVASAQSYPNKLVKIIVPYGPAGISDIAARTLGTKLSAMWKQPVVVENRVGGAGVIGANAVAKAAPDGYTLLIGTVAEFTVTQHLGKQPFNPVRDFIPIILLTDTPLMLVANAGAPFNNVREMVAYSKSQSGGLSFASPGIGTLNHLAGERFAFETGAKLTHIPYKGGAQAALAVVSGEVPVGVAGATVVMAHIDAGKLKPIGVASQQRLKSRPEWPTLAEAGIADFVSSNWVAMAAPTGTPPEIIAKLNADVNTVLKMDDVREQLAKIGAEPVGSTPDVLAARIRVDSERYGKIIDHIKLKID